MVVCLHFLSFDLDLYLEYNLYFPFYTGHWPPQHFFQDTIIGVHVYCQALKDLDYNNCKKFL